MVVLNFPTYDLNVTESYGNASVYDILRKKNVLLTAEEWVRQHVIHYLHREMNVPLHTMGIEKGFRLHGLLKRFDLVVFGTDGKPSLIVECKAPEVNVNEEVFYQIIRYNAHLKARYWLLTNGLQHLCCRLDYSNGRVEFLPSIPNWEELK